MLLMGPGVCDMPVHVLLVGQECMSCDPCALGRSSRNSIMGERLSIICPTLLVASVLATCTCFV